MSRFTFNRKRLLLKKLLGIRARVALLALILVAPLVLERAYSLEDARAKEIAQATGQFRNLAQRMMGDPAGRPGISTVLIDGDGTVLAAPTHQAGMIGRPLNDSPFLAATDDSLRTTLSIPAAGPGSRPAISVDETRIAASANRAIRIAYLQLGLICLFVLLGALVAAEKLIIRPIEAMAAMATRFGEGDWSPRAARSRLPAEFVPLARAFNAMAARLGQRERELVATNDRLTVMASMDMLSGLANRRGFQSRLHFEWMKAQQEDHGELSLLMIDVDHFKLFNDTYGHPEGDACVSRLGETLAWVAAETSGFAARYGGEEFCLLLPNTDASRALQIGETVRLAVEALAMPHRTSNYQTVTVSIGVACITPNDTQQPGELIEAADAALYAAKRRGRNTVVEHGFGRLSDGAAAIALAS